MPSPNGKEPPMLNPPTMEQLQQLKLTAMAAAWAAQQQDASCTQLSFDERFALLVQAEWVARENSRLTRTLQAATLKCSQACIEGIDYPARRELDKGLVRQLATGRWIQEHQQILVSGMTGTGKTYVACAFAQQACRQGDRARYWRVPRLFQECALARADGTYGRLLGQLARMDVLVLDDFGLVCLQDAERRDLLEILEDRYGTRSTIVTSQLDPALWHQAIGDPTLADAICDRLLHNAHRLKLKGPSRRKKEDTPMAEEAA